VLPDWFVLLAFIVVPAAAAVVAHFFVRRLVTPESLLESQHVMGFLVSIVGVLYAVVLGFVVVTVWSSFDSIQRTADEEAGYVSDAYSYSRLLNEPERTKVGNAIAAYAVDVHDREWNALAQGTIDPRPREDLLQAFAALNAEPVRPNATFAQALRSQSEHDEVQRALNGIFDHRRLRLIEARSVLPASMNVALVCGAFIVVAFVFLFGVKNAALQLSTTALVAGCIGLLLGIVVIYDAPYRGVLRVSSGPWEYVIRSNHFRNNASYLRPNR
jgi:hypothetical protein